VPFDIAQYSAHRPVPNTPQKSERDPEWKLQRLMDDIDRKSEPATRPGEIDVGGDTARSVAPTPRLPATIPPAQAGRRWRRFAIALLAVLIGAGGGGIYWWKHSHPGLPPGISFGNGRLEADEIDISTKFAGRVAELRADIGDAVTAGQLVARMDTRDLQESLKKSQAQVEQARRLIEEANANLEQQRTAQKLAAQELERTQSLVANGWATKELFDQRKQALDGATAAVSAATTRVAQAERALDASQHDVGLTMVNIRDNDLVAPVDGRLQYRLANIGEVLPAGGKVFTMLDSSYAYMDIYLPTIEAGKIKIGTDARIVLDAYPDRPIPAKVSFIASQAQFTPKTVETQSERDKLMFRIRVRIDPERSRIYAPSAQSGLPGVAYIRVDANAAWPANLSGRP
jgi:HlyD family secretion protein